MKFFKKDARSPILADDLVYRKNSAASNKRLLNLLLQEQKNFCAYTEKRVEALDSCEVEHFNSGIKYNDNYYNYYAVLRKANQYKKDEQYLNALFFNSLFFQTETGFFERIRYENGQYEERNAADVEAKDLIDFLGLNNHELFVYRARFVKRIKKHFQEAAFDQRLMIEYFTENPGELSFVTALEIELAIDLGQFYS